MKTLALVTLGLTALITAQSPAHATATASAIISDVTCTQVTNAGTLVSSPSFTAEYSVVGPVGQPRYAAEGPNFASTCVAGHLGLGEFLTMSAHVTLTVQDQGLSGAGGGELLRLPYFRGGVLTIPSGFEFASAVADISNHLDARDGRTRVESIIEYGIQQIQTTQDAFANTVTFSGILESTLVPVFPDPISSGANNARMDLWVFLWAVSGVPEPENYAMLLAGLGVLGFVARRRKKRVA